MCDIWKSADPGGIKLARRQESGDFLVGSPGNEGNRISCRPLQIGLQASQKLKIVGEKYRRMAKSNGVRSPQLPLRRRPQRPAGPSHPR